MTHCTKLKASGIYDEDEIVRHAMKMRGKKKPLIKIGNCTNENCKKAFFTLGRNQVFCSLQCKKMPRGNESANWRGGRFLDGQGYIRLKTHTHPNRHKGNIVAEHRLVMESHLGRYLKPFESVHHKNGIRSDNRIENLELWTRPQPTGQRVDDLISWIVDNYQSETAAKLEVKNLIQSVIRRVEAV